MNWNVHTLGNAYACLMLTSHSNQDLQRPAPRKSYLEMSLPTLSTELSLHEMRLPTILIIVVTVEIVVIWFFITALMPQIVLDM